MGRNWKNKPHTYAEIKQQASKQPMDQSRDQTGNQKLPWDKWKWKHSNPTRMAHSESSSKREIHSITDLPKETIKILTKQSKLIPKGRRTRTTNKAQSE